MSVSTTLGDFFRVRKEKGEAGLPTLSVTMNDGLVDRADLDRKMETNLAPEEHLRVREGDIAYNMMRMWQGAFGRAEKDGIVSPAYVVVEPREKIDSRFAAHWFKSARMIHLFWAYSYGLTEDRLRLYADDFCQIPASPPLLTEQRRIAGILDTWDRAIAQSDALIDAKRRLHFGLSQSIYAPAINEDGNLGIDWEPCSMSELAEVVGGGTPSTANPAFWAGDIPWCTPTDLADLPTRYISATERMITAEGLKASSANLLPSQSIVLCSRASVGECAINTLPMSTNQGFQSLIPHRSDDTLFLYYMIRALKRRLLRISAGSTFQEFSRTELRGLEVAAPPPDKRTAIGAALAKLDDEIDILRACSKRLKEQKRSLMQSHLGGDARGVQEAAE
ncbi:restriction endonuclease subunit S [Stappia indica]|uniref:restriction endonuclease subunit S n=1 Tax=Stappia indica TaxID=538381 RepID=UPI00082C38DB|nr:restriction endonuclease subunit S [Stappia indica]